MSVIRESYVEQGVSKGVIDVVMHSWRNSTKTQYAPYIKMWLEYCEKNGLQYQKPTVSQVADFLESLHKREKSYAQLCMARSALASFISFRDRVPLGKQPLIQRYMRGRFELAPQFPKYPLIWDVSILLNYFRKLGDPNLLSMKVLGKKLAMLISILAGGHRCQTIHAINTLDITITAGQCNIPFYTSLKQTRPGKHLKPMAFKVYTTEPALCVVNNLTCYSRKTKKVRTDSALFLSYQKPHKGVTKDTISRWSREMMSEAGINTDLYTTHSSRSAASSMAHQRGLPMRELCEACGWSREKTFAQHYNKELVKTLNVVDFVL